MYGQMQEMQAERGIPEDERDAWKEWYDANRGDFNNIKAARLAYAGHKALEAAKNPVRPTNGNGGTPPATRAAAVKQKVNISLRPMGSEETRKTVAQMRGDDFDAQIAALQAEGRHAEARTLQGKLNAGELDLMD
jgi:hypothetical protein